MIDEFKKFWKNESSKLNVKTVDDLVRAMEQFSDINELVIEISSRFGNSDESTETVVNKLLTKLKKRIGYNDSLEELRTLISQQQSY